MTVILDQYAVLEKGTFEIRQLVTVDVSAEEARRKVARWLRRDVSHMLGTATPTLVIGKQTIWRVPVHFSAPQVGVVGQVGTVDVDAITGELGDPATCQTMITQQAQALAATLPPFQSYPTMPAASIPADVLRAPMITLDDADEPVLMAATTT